MQNRDMSGKATQMKSYHSLRNMRSGTVNMDLALRTGKNIGIDTINQDGEIKAHI